MELDLKSVVASITGSIEGMKDDFNIRLKNLQCQTDAIDSKLVERHGGGGSPSGLEAIKAELEKDAGIATLMRHKRGRAVIQFKDFDPFERKSTLTAGTFGYPTVGVMESDRSVGIVQEARQVLTVRSVLSSRPVSTGMIDFVKVSSPMVKASPQVEAQSKFENQLSLTTHSEKIRTIATFMRASRQVLDDLAELGSFIQTGLSYYVNLTEELELLSGDGTGEHLNGLITQATSFNSSLLNWPWTRIDVIGEAAAQLAIANELPPTFVVVNPQDWANLRLQKTGFGIYVLGDPQAAVSPLLFGLRVIPTTSIASGHFLVGSGSATAAEIRDRMETTIDISTEDNDNFTKNLVTIRVEKRLGLVVYRPASFIYGTFTQSPA